LTSLPYVGPFVVFLAMLGIQSWIPVPQVALQALFFGAMAVVIRAIAWPVVDFRVRNWAGSLLLGVGVFVLWIGPDLLFPGYRGHWLFSNVIAGSVASGLPEDVRGDSIVLLLRGLRASLIVPIVEELFWRAWLMRWLISADFAAVPLGKYSSQAFWIVAVLFASEHGPYWDVGLATGVLYNWWMVRTRSLGDLILTHGVTNACLSLYVVVLGKWEYWA
jgi:CAAX prenyl protease-like protein